MFNMSARSLLKVAFQIIGLVLLVTGICRAIIYLCGLFSQSSIPPYMQLLTVLMAIIPPLVGVFLLLKTEPLIGGLYTEDTEINTGRDLFRLAMKVTGMVFLVYALPDLIQIITSIMYIINVSPAISVTAQVETLATKLVATLLYMVIGWYLIVDGKLLLNLAYKNQD